MNGIDTFINNIGIILGMYNCKTGYTLWCSPVFSLYLLQIVEVRDKTF